MDTNPSFLARHEFLIRRLHSLSGLIPVGAYMCIHLLTNASTLDSSATFQRAVYQIHSLGSILPLVEWVFIFIPILFHGIIGVVIIRGGLPNYGSYKYTSNLRYTLQRASGMIAFAFIMWHVFQMHGWFHFEAWQKKDRKRCQGPEKVSGTVFLFLRSAVRAKRTLQTKLLDHLLGPRRVAIGTATLNAATEGSQLGVRLRGVHMIDPTWATGKWPSG